MGTHRMPSLTPVQYDLIYNMLSLRLGSFAERYKAALCFTGLVTFIAMYHYFRIFDSFNAAYTPCEVQEDGAINYNKCDPAKYGYSPTGIPFNDAYRYVDWFLTVPLLLIEIVLVMRLSEEETFQRCTTLGVGSALMILNGYPGETSGVPGTRWCFWFLSMLPFTYIVYTLFVLLVHIPNCVHHANDVRLLLWQGWPLRWLHGCHPGRLHCLRHHLQVWCWLPRVSHWSCQVHG